MAVLGSEPRQTISRALLITVLLNTDLNVCVSLCDCTGRCVCAKCTFLYIYFVNAPKLLSVHNNLEYQKAYSYLIYTAIEH